MGPFQGVLPLAPVCTLIQFDKTFINFAEDERQPPKIDLNGISEKREWGGVGGEGVEREKKKTLARQRKVS